MGQKNLWYKLYFYKNIFLPSISLLYYILLLFIVLSKHYKIIGVVTQ